MRPSKVPVLALTLALALGSIATRASAGEEIYTTPLCADAAAITAYFTANSDFSGSSECPKLCKKTYGQCKQFLGKSKSCENAAVSAASSIGKAEICKPIPGGPERQACQEAYNNSAKAAKGSIKNEDAAARDECSAIYDTCAAGCTPTE